MKNIKNIANYAKELPYIVARECDGELWFWDGFRDLNRAIAAASYIDGQVYTREE